MHVKSILLSSVLATAVVVPALAADASATAETPAVAIPAGSITLGQFFVEMARILDPSLPAELTPADAAARLTEAGFEVPEDTDYNATLTEGDVVRFASAVGVRLKSLNPNEAFPGDKVPQLGSMLRDSMGDGQSTVAAVMDNGVRDRGDSASDRAKEKRKKKKVFESPSGSS